MTYKTILVYFDKPGRAQPLLDTAHTLAEQHQAHLIGLYVVPPVEYYVSSEFPVPLELTNHHDEFHQQRAAQIEQMFRSVTENQSYPSEWRCADTRSKTLVATVAGLANTADLLLMRQSDESDVNNFQKELPERVLLNTSRPVIFVPPSSSFSGTASHVFVGFDGSKESVRAIFDAIPILQLAEKITIHQLNPSDYERHHVLGTSAELVQTLARHQVSAVFSQSESHQTKRGDELILLAQENGADLMVTGAYGHRRVREKMFGGTTRTLFKNMQVPVLMSC